MRVKVITQDGRASVVDIETGRPLAVRSVVAFANADKPFPTAIIELMSVDIDADADARFEIIHPITGLKQGVRKIEFDDGTVLDFPHE